MEHAKQFRKRNAILTYLQETKDHPSAEMVLDLGQDPAGVQGSIHSDILTGG